MVKRNLTIHRLSLGEEVIITYRNSSYPFKLIKVTPKGYNFLNLTSDKCPFYPHFYPSKNELFPHPTKMTFFIPTYIQIKKLNHNTI